MAQIIIITGGSRSGKSTYAQTLAESIPGSRIYIATCPPLDEEMAARIQKHQAQRQDSFWQTLEETIDLAGALLKTRKSRVRLLDCLTLCTHLLAACKELPGTVIFVTNEVGMGIVPDNLLSRHYRDLAGRCNQIMAAGADRVILMVSGLPLSMK
jgi:adenosylcobinamide kinase / adenosylcobinamide-phosphate guanylyltransferase